MGVGGRIQNALPESAAQITLLQSDELDTAQTGLKVLEGLPIVLVGLSLLLFGAALLLAPDRRRRSLLIYGLGLIGAGLAALLVRSSGGGYLSGSLATTASVEPSIEAAWDIFTPLLKEAATATIFYGVVAVGRRVAGRPVPPGDGDPARAGALRPEPARDLRGAGARRRCSSCGGRRRRRCATRSRRSS